MLAGVAGAQTTTSQTTTTVAPAVGVPVIIAPSTGTSSTTRTQRSISPYGTVTKSDETTYRNNLGGPEDRTSRTTIYPPADVSTHTKSTTGAEGIRSLNVKRCRPPVSAQGAEVVQIGRRVPGRDRAERGCGCGQNHRSDSHDAVPLNDLEVDLVARSVTQASFDLRKIHPGLTAVAKSSRNTEHRAASMKFPAIFVAPIREADRGRAARTGSEREAKPPDFQRTVPPAVWRKAISSP